METKIKEILGIKLKEIHQQLKRHEYEHAVESINSIYRDFKVELAKDPESHQSQKLLHYKKICSHKFMHEIMNKVMDKVMNGLADIEQNQNYIEESLKKFKDFQGDSKFDEDFNKLYYINGLLLKILNNYEKAAESFKNGWRYRDLDCLAELVTVYCYDLQDYKKALSFAKQIEELLKGMVWYHEVLSDDYKPAIFKTLNLGTFKTERNP